MISRALVVFVFCFFSLDTFSADLVKITREKKTEAESEQAAREKLLSEILKEVLKEEIDKLVSSANLKKNKKIIQDQFLSQAPKYFPFVDAAPVTTEGKEYLLKANLSFDRDSLRGALLRRGLLFKGEVPTRILPLFTLVEGEKRYRWWMDERNAQSLSDKMKFIERELASGLTGEGFYYIQGASEPQGLRVPSPFQAAFFLKKDLAPLAQLNDAGLILLGEITIPESSTLTQDLAPKIDLTVFSINEQKDLLKITRTLEQVPMNDKGLKKIGDRNPLESFGEDLGRLIRETFASGTSRFESIELVVNSAAGDFKTDEFKETLKNGAPSVKEVHERKFSATETTFKALYEGSPEALLKELKKIKKFSYRISLQDEKIVFDKIR